MKANGDLPGESSWRVLQTIDLGTTARVLVVERDGARYALKTVRDEDADAGALLTEYRVLQHLNQSPAQRYVPRVEQWLPEHKGFLMAHLRYPTPAEREAPDWLAGLARALRALHGVALPQIAGLPDDRPDVARALTQRLRTLFDLALRTDTLWGGLAERDRPKLERVRARYQPYVSLLPQVEEGLANAPVALTHGDLAGDNVMLTREGRLTIVDWGSARISAAWADVASLAAYSEWSPAQRRRFYGLYLGDTAGSWLEALRVLETLSRLHRYRSCVQSLLWLNEEGEGLDAIGRAYFERQLTAL